MQVFFVGGEGSYSVWALVEAGYCVDLPVVGTVESVAGVEGPLESSVAPLSCLICVSALGMSSSRMRAIVMEEFINKINA